MAKNNTNGTETGAALAAPTCTPTIHLILQGKSGVGKSIVASWLAEFLIGRGQPVRCLDGDPVNRSLGQIKALNVEKLDLLNDEGVVQRTRYDALINRFLTEQAVFLVDNGATAFLPFWTFIVESDVISTLRAAGRRVYIHIPISGGDMLNDTLLGFQTLAETAAEKSLVVWINEHFGEIEREGKTFDQMQVFLDNREKVLTSIGIPQEVFWSHPPGSNRRPADYESAALPAELGWPYLLSLTGTWPFFEVLTWPRSTDSCKREPT